MPVSDEDLKQEIVQNLVDLVKDRLPQEEAGNVSVFAAEYFKHVPPADLIARDVNDLYGAALSHLRFANHRQAGPKIRVFNPRIDHHGWQSTHTIVEIVADDMPFLVDSIANALNTLELAIHLIVHPVLALTRGDDGQIINIDAKDFEQTQHVESFMHFEVDRRSEEEFLVKVEQSLTRVLRDVANAVGDWRTMSGTIDQALEDLDGARKHIAQDELAEVEAFARWLASDQFTFLGYSRYQVERDPEQGIQLRRVKGSGLGILRDHDDGALSRSFKELSPSARARAIEPQPAIAISKAHARSTVHRASYLDYIGFKRYDADGNVIGENRFLGLFTSAAYNLSPRFIPLLRRKVDRILAQSGHARSGHAGKALMNVLETYPRDELFQTNEDTLFQIVRDVLYIQDRQQIRLFLRVDQFERFISCLVFVPRERYNTVLRERIQRILETELDGQDTEFQAQLSDSPLARIQFIVRTPNGVRAELDTQNLENKLINETRSWADQLREALDDALGEEAGNQAFQRYRRGFTTSYMEQVPARLAVTDVQAIDNLPSSESALSLNLFRKLEDPDDIIRLKLIRADRPAHLADVLPILENMGARVLFEVPFGITNREGRYFSIHDFGLQPTLGKAVDVAALRNAFQESFQQVWSGQIENDGFNQLVLAAGLEAQPVIWLRTYAKYLRQLGIPFSQSYIEQTLIKNAGIALLLVRLFDARFNPDLAGDRDEQQHVIEQSIAAALENVTSLDEDRILRRYLALIKATLRTNAFQHTDGAAQPNHISIKLDPARVPGMPLPLPAFEIFVYSPKVEGVHLRGGKVARGGLRWSDRREDFRTEILGLMKAQMVKNGVIVPVGAKGGFVVKQPPADPDRGKQQEEAVRCYKTFLSGLLDITDNQVKGEIIPPERVVRYDDDDPYLVVAADKGTATFSDFANAVSVERQFWLGDAFASGGSAGYDHKVMGITAKGAWESVKRHFREMGVDCQTEPFTVAGVGDMSGDVFGNGMLLSPAIKLIAAFDHRHIFIDPDPDPASSFAERARLFALDRSSWTDYNAELISDGGGVFSRNLKSIPLSPKAQAALGFNADKPTPAELLNAILKAPVDLLWNGGIGTYVKSSAESHDDAKDRANDAIRVNGNELRCKVVGEGGNLGLTQLGRIEFAKSGGRINTDFIDNSAGVDCSDHEVNIKILLGDVVADGDLTVKHRNELLASMTDEVSDLCLRDNILQNLALSMSGADSASRLYAQVRLMQKLESANRLDRTIEELPNDEEIAERTQAEQGLTRPEASVMLSYAKMELYDRLLATDVPDHPYLARDLAKYFPRPLRRRYLPEIERHGLRREIIATWLANSMVNRGLDTFVSELEDETGAALADIALAYVTARDSLGLLPLLGMIEALPQDVPVDLQIRMLTDIRSVLMHGTRWFLAQHAASRDVALAIEKFGTGIAQMSAQIDDVLTGEHAVLFAGMKASLVEAGVEHDVASRVASLDYLLAMADAEIVTGRLYDDAGDLSAERIQIAALYFALDQTFKLPWLRAQFRRTQLRDAWDRLALNMLDDEISGGLRRLTAEAARQNLSAASPDLAAWCGELNGFARFRQILADIEDSNRVGLGMTTVAVKAFAALRPAA